MKNDYRFVVDTNIIVSASLLAISKQRQVLQRVFQLGRLLLSLEVTKELEEVLSRPKFDAYVLPKERSEFLAALIQRGTFVPIFETIQACRDPKDNKFLELAVNGKADYLISGDSDLLVLHPFRGIPILSSKDFLNISFLF